MLNSDVFDGFDKMDAEFRGKYMSLDELPKSCYKHLDKFTTVMSGTNKNQQTQARKEADKHM